MEQKTSQDIELPESLSLPIKSSKYYKQAVKKLRKYVFENFKYSKHHKHFRNDTERQDWLSRTTKKYLVAYAIEIDNNKYNQSSTCK